MNAKDLICYITNTLIICATVTILLFFVSSCQKQSEITYHEAEKAIIEQGIIKFSGTFYLPKDIFKTDKQIEKPE